MLGSDLNETESEGFLFTTILCLQIWNERSYDSTYIKATLYLVMMEYHTSLLQLAFRCCVIFWMRMGYSTHVLLLMMVVGILRVIY